ncbi:hypothetical protein GGTG_04987 [Gaeumannomyces tritici R3-111a-1]|uniref:Endoplasmic reticulum junction formation protein lunapark n=1 Tax=Gaeumannomyces tritici (strain R3-111a-1) TaxID=644352 RepID=J3NUN1_GAET3|nr:hypothetical protein GGTG_04987 [Gaeumannomyces tritici R3-111a-1]EJT79905.1 hypothetical protein GGTG_04987 [Gaeumannomyces tritici R3-111a-1]
MVSFWPWGGDSSSTASFEKALSTLSAKITATQAQLERTRSTSRRVKVLWSLYLSFAYLVYAIVLVLVVGWTHMGPYEWTGIAGGPVLIYTTRTILTIYFDYRIDSLASRLKDQQAERAKTVQKLKEATKYDSTLELLEKYGGEPRRPRSGKSGGSDEGEGPEDQDGDRGRQDKAQSGPIARAGTPGRTGMAPPPTANIPRSRPGTPLPPSLSPPQQYPQAFHDDHMAEFAPNAFGPGGPPLPSIPNAQYAPAFHPGMAESHWYDRIMDLLLGEDETAAKNRIVLICGQCRLVNGQAPPGAKSLADMGRWRCMGCGAMNGEDASSGRRIIKEVLQERAGASKAAPPTPTSDSADGDFKTETDSDSLEIVQPDDHEGDSAQWSEADARKHIKKEKK